MLDFKNVGSLRTGFYCIMSGMYYDRAPVTTYTNAMGAEVVLSHRASEALHGVRRRRFSCREQVSIRKRNCITGRNVENLIGIKNAWTREVKFKTRDEITQQVGSHPRFVAEGCENLWANGRRREAFPASFPSPLPNLRTTGM